MLNHLTLRIAGACMLQIEHLSKTYANGVEALKDVSLTIPTGMFGLLGPNGAGKSTLMRTLATLQEPDAGRDSAERHRCAREPRCRAAPARLPAAGVRRVSAHLAAARC